MVKACLHVLTPCSTLTRVRPKAATLTMTTSHATATRRNAAGEQKPSLSGGFGQGCRLGKRCRQGTERKAQGRASRGIDKMQRGVDADAELLEADSAEAVDLTRRMVSAAA